MLVKCVGFIDINNFDFERKEKMGMESIVYCVINRIAWKCLLISKETFIVPCSDHLLIIDY
jgi:hypothetical protein